MLNRNLLKFKKGKCQVKGTHRTAGTRKSCGVNQLKSSFNTKDLLGFIRKRVARSSKVVNLPLHSVLLSLHVEFCVLFSAVQDERC